MADDTYLNFPIVLIQGAFTNIKDTCKNVILYAVYARYLTLYEGTERQRIEQAASYLNMTLGNWKYNLDEGKALHNSLADNLPMTGIKRNLIFEFRDQYKSSFQISVLTAFLALRSIIGSKPYLKMGNDFLVARMAGFSSTDFFPEELPESIKKINNRYQLDKIKVELQLNWNLTYYSNHTRGFYASFTLNNEQLILQAERKRQKYQEKLLAESKKEALKKVMNDLNKKAH